MMTKLNNLEFLGYMTCMIHFNNHLENIEYEEKSYKKVVQLLDLILIV